VKQTINGQKKGKRKREGMLGFAGEKAFKKGVFAKPWT
jgi:hypothetical protein